MYQALSSVPALQRQKKNPQRFLDLSAIDSKNMFKIKITENTKTGKINISYTVHLFMEIVTEPKVIESKVSF